MVFWILITWFAILHICRSTCPDGYDIVSNGQCRGYYGTVYVRDNETTTAVIAKCGELNLQPVIIHNDDEQSYWNGRNSRAGIVLGLICDTTTGKWKWTDGSALDFKPGLYNTRLDSTCQTGCVGFQPSSGYWNVWCDADIDLFDVFCMGNLTQPVRSADGCDSFEDDGACYQIGATVDGYLDAQLSCRSSGADVASIHNQKENSFVRRLAVSKIALGGLYLGAMSGKGNDFEWSDRSVWDYDNFFPGFPISGLGDCLVMDTQGTTGEWMNVDCSSTLSVACMRQKNYTLDTCAPGPWKEGQLMYTPGYPYDASTPCDFVIAVDPGKRVELTVFLVEANTCCDHLVIGDSYFGGNVLANLTGYITDKTYTTSTSNSMHVSWQPNGGVNVRGAMFTFRGV